ncbi:MAG TPA: hypothetical protein VH331_16150 [Allosphingosinicella sp.]|jgi:hypothetical protein|nr:hypothetical protein [Allosphingosinicella sp.]
MKAAVMMAGIVLAVASTTPATGQTVADTSLQKLVLSTGYQANIARLFSSLPSDVFQRCPTLVSKGSTVTILKQPTFAADGYPTSGTWKQSFPVSGCGNDTIINFFFFAQPDEKITSLIGAPGDTHADPILQRDAMRDVMMAAKTQAPGCSAPHLRTTRFEGRPGAQAGGATARTAPSGWAETWTVSACGRLLTIPVTFIPDATGTRVFTEIRPKSGR